MNRRSFLLAAGAFAIAPSAFADEDPFWQLPRTLWLKRSATGEEGRFTYWKDGAIDQIGMWQVCHMLRDVRAGKLVRMDIGLLNLLRATQGWFEGHGLQARLDVLSGYRTAKTNDITEGAARNSTHLQGVASDFRIEGVPANYLGRLAYHFDGVGVGFYLQKNFVHADVLRKRAWIGR